MYYMSMPKKRISLTVEGDVVKQAKELGINMSAFLEIRLREYIAMIEGKHD